MGVWPFNPSVVTQDMMALSLETSSVGHLPLPQSSPVQAVLRVVCEHQLEEASLVQTSPTRAISTVIHQFHEDQVNPTLNEPCWNTLVNKALDNLTSSSAAFLVSDTPITLEHQLPAFTPSSFTPTRKQTHSVLDCKPETEHEQACHDALQEVYERESGYKGALYKMQSMVVLQGMFCDRLLSQLASQEEKKQGKNMNS
jgi:hypothetical protein